MVVSERPLDLMCHKSRAVNVLSDTFSSLGWFLGGD